MTSHKSEFLYSTTVSHSHYYTSVCLSHTCKMGIVMFMQDYRGVSVRWWSCVKLNMNTFQGSYSCFTACLEKPGRAMWKQYFPLVSFMLFSWKWSTDQSRVCRQVAEADVIVVCQGCFGSFLAAFLSLCWNIFLISEFFWAVKMLV